MVQSTLDTMNSNWKSLSKTGGIAALLAVFIFRRNLGAELMAFKGFGIFTVTETMPVRATEWFALLQNNPIVGLTLLEVFDIIEYTLVGVMFLSLCVVLWQSNCSVMLLATICNWTGIIIYFASNQAFAMLSLSARYSAATNDTQRAMFLAAGEGLLAINNPGVLYQGTGICASLFMVLLAGLLISSVMWQSNIFGKPTAATGILANSIGLTYFLALAFTPTFVVLPFVFSAPFRVIWYFLIARKLFQLSKDEAPGRR